MTDTPEHAKIKPESDADRAVATDPRQQAGQDESIVERLARDPASPQAKLDRALDESMDASDPPSHTPPGSNTQPAPSSGFDENVEAALRCK
ncbi:MULTISPECIES: hypothetical protein [unclassified Sphingomonas]|uniref:hypothetical protein n=1 Tax=unclassified Sphingomonas TaxID=196159 RepID=UPI0026C2298F